MESAGAPTIALDAMGGDHAPLEVVRAAAELSRSGNVRCLLVGDEERVLPLLAHLPFDPGRLVLRHAPAATGTEVAVPASLPAPGAASIEATIRLLAEGGADAVVSAGRTSECVLGCLRHLRLLPGVARPALAAHFPRRGRGPGLLLDVGATLRCHPRDFVSLALLGSTYWSATFGGSPRVGLLNVGSEPDRGGELLCRANRALAATPGIDFVGNVEGNELLAGSTDVVLCDGFTGNVVLKLLEGVAESAASLVQQALTRHWTWRLGILLLSGGLRTLRQLTNYAEYGGSPLLGFRSLFIKAHGRSRAAAIASAARLAARLVDADLPGRMARALAPGALSVLSEEKAEPTSGR